jgi:hypothetical protein
MMNAVDQDGDRQIAFSGMPSSHLQELYDN